jgi:2,5-dioxopentanoate dehydrogenase
MGSASCKTRSSKDSETALSDWQSDLPGAAFRCHAAGDDGGDGIKRESKKMTTQPVLIGGNWRTAHVKGEFQAENPRLGQPLPDYYPLSSWDDCDVALEQAVEAARELRALPPTEIARFLELYADRIDARGDELVEMAHLETALPKSPRLADVELPRTTGQLRQAAAAARDGSWCMATIDSRNNIRSHLAPLGPVCVFGPNNFPFAFNGIAGGDFAAAIAAGNPVIAKAHSSHPGTTRLFAEEALAALQETGLPSSTVQLIYRIQHEDGTRLVSDPRIGATGYTGSREAGMRLKAAADQVGKPIYLELSSINPVLILPGCLEERGAASLADEFTGSCLMGTGQFCTNPGLVIVLSGERTEEFIRETTVRFREAAVGTLLSSSVQQHLADSITRLTGAGARVLTGNHSVAGEGHQFANTLLEVSGTVFLEHLAELQSEAFGNCSLIVEAEDVAECSAILAGLEGNLTGSVYSACDGRDDGFYDELVPLLRDRVGRLLNDKMPTGVAVSPAMNHGGPFPATGHPGFTAVGIPAALRRFGALQCYDQVREHRLPPYLRDKNPTGTMWRYVDGQWSQSDVGPS